VDERIPCALFLTAQDNPIVATFLQYWEHGYMEWDEMLIGLVLALAQVEAKVLNDEVAYQNTTVFRREFDAKGRDSRIQERLERDKLMRHGRTKEVLQDVLEQLHGEFKPRDWGVP